MFASEKSLERESLAIEFRHSKPGEPATHSERDAFRWAMYEAGYGPEPVKTNSELEDYRELMRRERLAHGLPAELPGNTPEEIAARKKRAEERRAANGSRKRKWKAENSPRALDEASL